MKIQIIVDNPGSWYVPFAKKLNLLLLNEGHDSELVHSHEDLKVSDVLFILSCEKILKKKFRDLNQFNIVIHASDLPKGKGWSPLSWQVLEGKTTIPVTMILAEDAVDSGDILLKDYITLEGHELVDELREKLGLKINELCLKFARDPVIVPRPQEGDSTFYPRRTSEHSLLDVDKSLRELFNLFRIADNERYPVTFEMHGKRFKMKIYKVDEV